MNLKKKSKVTFAPTTLSGTIMHFFVLFFILNEIRKANQCFFYNVCCQSVFENWHKLSALINKKIENNLVSIDTGNMQS